jgi:hypothetical protein
MPKNPMTARTLSALTLGALMLSSLACGGSQPSNPLPSPTPTPSPSPTPTPTACTQLSEQVCATRADCAPQYVTEACDGPGCGRVYVGCLDRDPCEGLNEPSCLADSRCEALFRVPGCDRACVPGDPICGGCGQPQYAGCQTKTTPDCPPVCAIFCPYGNRVDENLCPTCECNPPPSGCEALDEATCGATPGCRVERDDEPCVCAACEAGAACPPCECAGGFRAPPAHDGGTTDPSPDGGVTDGGDMDGGAAPTFRCVAVDACGGLDERTCVSTPGCQPVFSGASGGASAPCRCPPDAETCACDAARPAPAYQGCVSAPVDPCQRLSEAECSLDADSCEPRYMTACPSPPPPSGGAGGAQLPPECTTTYAGCFSTGAPSCTSDAECPNAYCDFAEICDRSGKCTVSGTCRAASCDEGPASCDALPPVCPVGQTAAVRGGCWRCVDARTCQDPSSACFADDACLNGYCHRVDGPDGAPGQRPPPGECVFPTCGDGSTLGCRRAMPICPPGQTAEIVNGCYGDCVDARTCTTVGHETPCTTDAECPNGYCGVSSGDSGGSAGSGGASRPAPPPMVCTYPTCAGDGGPVSCLIQLSCPPGQAPAPRDGCFECVDARSCG